MSAPSTNTYLLKTADPGNLPNALALTATNQLALTQSGTDYILAPTDTLLSLATANRSGLLGYDNISKSILPVEITSDLGTIQVTNPFGTSGASSLNLEVTPSSTVQLVKVTDNGALPVISTQSTLNFINGTGITVSVANNAGENRADITINATGGGSSAITLTSDTGILITGSGTSSLTVNLPGSGTDSAVVQGNILVGGAGGAYSPLPIGANTYILTSNGTTASWQAPTAGANWSTITATTSPNIGTHNITNLGNIQFNETPISGAAPNKGFLGTDSDASNHLFYSSTALPNQYVVTTPKVGYSTPYCILFGNPTAGLNYLTTTVQPNDGEVVGFQDGTVKWIPNTVNTLPNGIVAFDSTFNQDQPYQNYPYRFIADTQLSINSIILVCGFEVEASVAAAGCFVINDYNNELGQGSGFYIVGASNEGSPNATAAYQIIKY